MLASTMQFSTNNPVTPPPTPTHGTRTEHARETRNNQTPPTNDHRTPGHRSHQDTRTTCAPHPAKDRTHRHHEHPAQPAPDRDDNHDRKGPVISGPNSVPNDTHHQKHQPAHSNPAPHTAHPTTSHTGRQTGHTTQATRRTRAGQHQRRHLFIDIPPMSTHRGTNARAMG